MAAIEALPVCAEQAQEKQKRRKIKQQKTQMKDGETTGKEDETRRPVLFELIEIEGMKWFNQTALKDFVLFGPFT